MLINKIASAGSTYYSVRILLICAILVFSLQVPDLAMSEMISVTDEELAVITAGGFSRFAINGNIIRADFDIATWTYTDIASLKLGFYDNGMTGPGWDNDWTAVQLGSPTEDLFTNGVYFEVEFENFNNPATRRLKSVKFGVHEMTGKIAAAFNSFSGNVGSGVQNRASNPFSEIILDRSGVSISLEVDGEKKGFHVQFDNAVTN